ncbi:L-gulono-1,4-lactone dehydrogenase-like [Mytilus trossulus]|uniref:L-gulono-1,4-lactone dehydrogenase-like n=1 Tax=Mytilus trossulus TaxID=6551 RepID=UPI0030055BCF
MVLSFLLLTVNANGDVVQNQIEPADGITDPQAFEAIYPDKNLIQDDNIFHAALVNIGGMGTVYSYTFRTVNAFFLTENRTFVTWEEAQDQILALYNRNIIEQGPVEGNLHSFEIFVNPYPMEPQGQVGVVICTLEYSNGPPKGERPDWHIIPHEWVRNGFVWACNKFQEVVPVLLNLLMLATTTDQPVTMNAVEALDPLSGLAVSGEVTVSECAMQTQNAEDVIQKIQALIDQYQQIQGENENQFATTPFAVRFSSPTNAYMAMQYNHQSMMIISNILVGTPNADNTLQQFRDLMRIEFSGRPHWGMVQNLDANEVGQIYPANNGVDPVDVFRNVMQQLDPDGIFRNQFINRVFFPGQNQ